MDILQSALKYLVFYSSKQKTKFGGDYVAFRRALERIKDEKIADYLLKHIFNSKICNTAENIGSKIGFDINHSMYTTVNYDTVTQTPLQVAIHYDNSAMATMDKDVVKFIQAPVEFYIYWIGINLII